MYCFKKFFVFFADFFGSIVPFLQSVNLLFYMCFCIICFGKLAQEAI